MTDHELMQLSEVVGLALKQRGATLDRRILHRRLGGESNYRYCWQFRPV